MDRFAVVLIFDLITIQHPIVSLRTDPKVCRAGYNTYLRNMEKFNDIIKSETPTLVDFHANWCGPCKAMSPIIDQLKKEMGPEVRILKIDIDKNHEVSARFKIKSVPTLMLFKKGEIPWKNSGGMDLRSLKQKIKASL